MVAADTTDSTNHPVRNPSLSEPSTNQSAPKVAKSKSELSAPNTSMKRRMNRMSKRSRGRRGAG
jgi:hypothetical protein